MNIWRGWGGKWEGSALGWGGGGGGGIVMLTF